MCLKNRVVNLDDSCLMCGCGLLHLRILPDIQTIDVGNYNRKVDLEDLEVGMMINYYILIECITVCLNHKKDPVSEGIEFVKGALHWLM